MVNARTRRPLSAVEVAGRWLPATKVTMKRSGMSPAAINKATMLAGLSRVFD
jgi:hypothetical protein